MSDLKDDPEIQAYLSDKPDWFCEAFYKFPPGTMILDRNQVPAFVIGIHVGSGDAHSHGIIMSTIDPGVDFEGAQTDRFIMCLDCLMEGIKEIALQ